jgi:hypothetical protein
MKTNPEKLVMKAFNTVTLDDAQASNIGVLESLEVLDRVQPTAARAHLRFTVRLHVREMRRVVNRLDSESKPRVSAILDSLKQEVKGIGGPGQPSVDQAVANVKSLMSQLAETLSQAHETPRALDGDRRLWAIVERILNDPTPDAQA